MEILFEVSNQLKYQLSVIDSVLAGIGKTPLLDNSDFRLIESSAGTFGLDIKFDRQGNHAPIQFILESSGLRIDLDGISESFQWELKAMKPSNQVSSFISLLLTCFVLVERFDNRTDVFLFDKNGQQKYGQVLRYNSVLGFVLKGHAARHLFLPIY